MPTKPATTQRLRDAAQKIRDTTQGFVEAAGAGPMVVVMTGDGYGIDVPGYAIAEGLVEEEARYFAFWSPPVAIAVADWLDDEAVGAQTPTGEPTAHALAIAHLILGNPA